MVYCLLPLGKGVQVGSAQIVEEHYIIAKRQYIRKLVLSAEQYFCINL